MRNKSVVFVDGQVTMTMIVCIIIAVIVFGFRYKAYEPYTPVPISVRNGKIMSGQIVRMTADTRKYTSEELEWDFGTKHTQKGSGSMVTHIYSAPGRYEVTLLIKGKYREYKTIDVVEQPSPPKPKPLLFVSPLKVEVGKGACFTDTTANAVRWEWRFGETNQVDATTQKTFYTFKSSGSKIVSLVVNGSLWGETMIDVQKKVVSEDRIVRPLPPPPKVPEHPTTPPLPNQ